MRAISASTRRIAGLEDGGDFVGRLDRALPAIDRADGAEDVDAGGEPFLDRDAADAFGLLGIGEHRIDRDDAHAAAAEHVRAPYGRGEQQRAGRLVEHREPDGDARDDGENAKDDLGAEGRVDGDRGGAAALNPADLPREDDQDRDHDPRPPAVQELQQERVVGQREAGAARPVDAGGEEAAVHVGPAAGDIAGAEARDPGAEHQLDEQSGEREDAPAGQPRRLRSSARRKIERGPDQRAHQEQGHQQVRREAIGADLGARPRAPT